MSQSLAQLIVHIVFATKYREKTIIRPAWPNLHAYLAQIGRNHHSLVHIVGGLEDHVHIACTLPRTMCVADLIKEYKSGSSAWIKTQKDISQHFAWQKGYAAFSVSRSHLPKLIRYIKRQECNHHMMDFKTEYLSLLDLYEVEYDEEFLWAE